MTINNLKKVLDFALDQAKAERAPIICNTTDNDDDNEAQIFVLEKMLQEVKDIEKRTAQDEDIWQGKIHLISANDIIDLLNITTYQDYADVYRKKNEQPTFDEYKQATAIYSLDSLSDEMWRSGYEVISDLFDANEENGTACDEQATFDKDICEVIAMVNKPR